MTYFELIWFVSPAGVIHDIMTGMMLMDLYPGPGPNQIQYNSYLWPIPTYPSQVLYHVTEKSTLWRVMKTKKTDPDIVIMVYLFIKQSQKTIFRPITIQLI